MVSKQARVYDIIESKAGSNTAMQGISGVLGFPWTAIADVGVIFTHYAPMLNDIRNVYDRTEISSEIFAPILKGCSSEIISDLIVDKFVGQIPIIGIGANMICAKAMTWRLGIMFGMLSARGEEINTESVSKCAKLIRKLFPQKQSLLFKKPSIIIVEKLLFNVENDSQETFDDKIVTILDNLENN